MYREIGEKSTAMGRPNWSNRFRQMVVNRGSDLGAARLCLARRARQPGFHRVRPGFPHLSLEVAVLQRPWRGLFTPQELGKTRRPLEAKRVRLRQVCDEHLTNRLEQVLRQLVR